MTDQHTPLTDQPIDDYETAIADYRQHAPTGFACCSAHPAADAATALLAEVRRLRTERTRYRTAWRLARTRALSTGGAADRYATRARETQTALQDMLAVILGSQMELDAAQARVTALEAVLAKTPAPAAPRTITESEHNAAWHAIEGAAGEDMADPGTVLNAVLHALGITPPGAEETHVVADDSDDPEHVDDCPGCEAAASAVSGAADSRPA